MNQLFNTKFHLINVSYTLKWQHKDHNHYQWSECGRLFNTMTGRELKKVYKSGSVGYCIKGKFTKLDDLKKQIELIKPKINVPF